MRVLFVALFLLILSIGSAYACSCMKPTDKTAAESYRHADIVAEFKITDAQKGWGSAGAIVQMDTINVYKGDDVPNFINANFNPSPAMCGNSFKEEEVIILGLYDTRNTELRQDNARGYGFRVMVSCDQYNIRHYIKMNKSEETKGK